MLLKNYRSHLESFYIYKKSKFLELLYTMLINKYIVISPSLRMKTSETVGFKPALPLIKALPLSSLIKSISQ